MSEAHTEIPKEIQKKFSNGPLEKFPTPGGITEKTSKRTPDKKSRRNAREFSTKQLMEFPKLLLRDTPKS